MSFRPKDDPNPPPQPNLATAMDSLLEFTELMGGMRADLTRRGFTEREAAQIVVSFNVTNAASSWKEVGLQWGLSLPE